MNRLEEDRAFEPTPADGDPDPVSDAPDVPPPDSASPPLPGHHPGMRRRAASAAHETIVPEYHATPSERLRAAFRTHQREIGAVVGLVALLVLGIVGTSTGMVRAARQRDAALAARAEAERLRTVAETGRQEAAAVSGFLEAVLGSVNPWGAERAAEVSVEQLLDVAAAKLDAGALAGQKDAEARVRFTLGHAFAGLALNPRAEPQFRRALELQRELYAGRDHPDLALSMNALASALLSAGGPKLNEAEQLANASLEMRRRLWGSAHKEVADSLDTASAVARVRRDFFTAERRVDEALAMRRLLPQDATSKNGLASSLTNRAVLMWRRGELAATIADLREAMDLYRGVLPDDHLMLGVLRARLGAALAAAGRRADAIRELRQSLDVRRRHRAESHGDVADVFRRLALLMVEEGQADERQFADAEALLNDRDGRLRTLPIAPVDQCTELYGHFVSLYQAWGKPDRSAAWGRRFQESIARELLDATAAVDLAPAKAQPYFQRAKLRVRAGQFRAAADDYARGLAIDPAGHWPWFYRGCLLAYLGEESAYRQHSADMLERFGASPDGHVLDCMVKTGSLYPGGDAERLNGIANQVWSLGGKDERNATWFRLLKGMAEYRAGHAERAVNWLTASVTPDLPHRTATAELYLAMAYHRLGKTDEAKQSLARAEQRVERFSPKAGVGDLAEGGIENWLICQAALREARGVVAESR